MNAPPTRAAIVAAIVAKDLRSFARDRLWVILTPFSLAFVIVAFWLAPAQVDETIRVGTHPPGATEMMNRLASLEEDEDDGSIVFVPFEDRERMVAALEGEIEDAAEGEDDILMGLAFPADFSEAIAAGSTPEVVLYLTPDVPTPVRDAFAGEVRELGFALKAMLAEQPAVSAYPVTFPEDEAMVLGVDRLGDQVSMRDKLRPMLAVLVLMLGSIAIAGLVAAEIEQRTVTALLVTPARTGDVLAAKGLTGTLLGVSQALIFLLATASLGPHWLLVTLVMVLGALMMAALGMIAGTAGRDFMSTMFLAVALIIPMAAPTFAVLFPGGTSLWIKLLPSWGFTEALVGLLGYGLDPTDLTLPILSALAWTVGLLGLSLLLLRRRVEAL